MELKTLKEIFEKLPQDAVDYNVLRAEAIKWVKEDINDLDRLDELTAVEVIERWQKRLNISEEDLE